MRFAEIPGNGSVKQAMINMARVGRVHHALLLYENEGCGALALGLAFLQYLNCENPTEEDSCGECHSCRQISRLSYPDMRFTFPITSGSKVSGAAKDLTCDEYAPIFRELIQKNPYFLENELGAALGIEKKSGLITVAEGRAIMQKLSLAPVTDGWRGIFIWLPEKMNQQTANMLLKSLEEPQEKTIFILITHNPESVISTITSRCQGIRVMPLTKAERALIKRESDDADASLYEELFKSLIETVSSRDLQAALEVGEALAGLESREKQKAFCIFAGEGIRNLMLFGRKMEAVADVSEDADWYRNMASRLPGSFPEAASGVFGKTYSMLERNVLAKILFCNMVTRLFAAAGQR